MRAAAARVLRKIGAVLIVVSFVVEHGWDKGPQMAIDFGEWMIRSAGGEP